MGNEGDKPTVTEGEELLKGRNAIERAYIKRVLKEQKARLEKEDKDPAYEQLKEQLGIKPPGSKTPQT